MLRYIPLVNPSLLEKLIIISWNCWVKIMNEMEALSTFYMLPSLKSYLWLLQSQIMHNSEILHTLTNRYCNILLWSHNMLCHTACTFQWEVRTAQENTGLPFAVKSLLPSENFYEQTDFYQYIHFIFFAKRSVMVCFNRQIPKEEQLEN